MEESKPGRNASQMEAFGCSAERGGRGRRKGKIQGAEEGREKERESAGEV